MQSIAQTHGEHAKPRTCSDPLANRCPRLSLVSLHDASWTIRIRERDQEWPIGWWCWMPSAVRQLPLCVLQHRPRHICQAANVDQALKNPLLLVLRTEHIELLSKPVY